MNKNSEWPKYKFYRDIKEYGATDVFDLWAGKFTGSEAAEVKTDRHGLHYPSIHGRPGTLYVSEDAFDIYVPMIMTILPKFDGWGWNHFKRKRCYDLLAGLEAMQAAFKNSLTMEDMKVACDGKLYVTGWTFDRLQMQLISMTDDFITLVSGAIRDKVTVWISGP